MYVSPWVSTDQEAHVGPSLAVMLSMSLAVMLSMRQQRAQQLHYVSLAKIHGRLTTWWPAGHSSS
jgi:hypothetical protein